MERARATIARGSEHVRKFIILRSLALRGTAGGGFTLLLPEASGARAFPPWELGSAAWRANAHRKFVRDFSCSRPASSLRRTSSMNPKKEAAEHETVRRASVCSVDLYRPCGEHHVNESRFVGA